MNADWSTADIWIRRQFTLTVDDIPDIKLQVFHDEDVEVYLNGALALHEAGYITDYLEYNIPAVVRPLLRPGENTIAVHCHQTTGGQGIDVGIIIPQPGSGAEKREVDPIRFRSGVAIPWLGMTNLSIVLNWPPAAPLRRPGFLLLAASRVILIMHHMVHLTIKAALIALLAFKRGGRRWRKILQSITGFSIPWPRGARTPG